MGNSGLRAQNYSIVRSYNRDNWARDPTEHECQVWRNRRTQQKAQVFMLQQTPSIEDMNRYELRSVEEHIVRVYHIAANKKQLLCVTSQYAQLLIEYIPIRLSMVGSLDLEEAITTMYAAFRGFQSIADLIGYVQPQEQLIGFNEEGKPKVWLNKQYNLNFSPTQLWPKTLQTPSEDVKTLFQIIENKIRGQSIAQAVRKNILENNLSYGQAARVLEDYSVNHQLSLKRYVRTDILKRQLGTSKMTRYSSLDHLLPRSHNKPQPQTPKRQNVAHRIESCQNFQASIRPLQNIQTEKKSEKKSVLSFKSQAPSIRSFISASPPSHAVKATPKITFTSSQPKRELNINKVVEKVQLNLSSSPRVHPRLQKVSTNQLSFKAPPGRFAKNQTKTIKEPITKTEQIKKVVVFVQQRLQGLIEETPKKSGIGTQQTIIEKITNEHFNQELTQEQTFHLSHQKQELIQNESVAISGVFQPIQHEDLENHEKIVKKSVVTFAVEPQAQVGSKLVKKEITINFESFGVSLAPSMENISFAPKLCGQEDENEVPAQTSKSVHIEQMEQQSSRNSFSKHSKQEAPNFTLQSFQKAITDMPAVPVLQQYVFEQAKDLAPMSQEEYTNTQTFIQLPSCQMDFYQAYTPVESTVQAIFKKDSSNLSSSEKDYSHRVSAFVQIEQDAIKNQLKQIFQGKMFINRVESQYEMGLEKQSQASSKAFQKESRSNKLLNINSNDPGEDFLDVNFLEKSLNLKLIDMKKKKKEEIAEEEDQLNISKLDEKLQKYSASLISLNKEQEAQEPKELTISTNQLKTPNKLVMKSERIQHKQQQELKDILNDKEKILKGGLSTQNSPRYYKVLNHDSYKTKDHCLYRGQRQPQKYHESDLTGFSSSFRQYRSVERDHKTGHHKTEKYETWMTNQSKYSNYEKSLNKKGLIRDQATDLLEERYQKYVRKSKQHSKKQSDKYPYQMEARGDERAGKRGGYDHLRTILWN